MASVLIVDDEELSRFAVRKLLSRLFPAVLVAGEAENGRVAVELALSLRPDLVLMDIRIPAMNGIDAAQAILAALPSTRIIVLTAYDSFGFAQRAINLGVSGYLLKPVEEPAFEAVFGASLAAVEEREAAGAGAAVPGPAAAVPAPAGAAGAPPSAPGTAASPAAQGSRAAPAAARQGYPFEAERELFKALARGEGAAEASAALVEALGAGAEAAGGVQAFTERCLEFSSSFKRELRALGLAPEAAEAAGFPTSAGIAASTKPAELAASLHRGIAAAIAALEATRGAGRRGAIDRAIESLSLRELGLERVAELVGMSPQHLSRLFKELYGLRFVEYSTGLRIEAAKAALAEEAITVEELCRRLGWSDSAHFTKVFKERTGLTPKVFARRIGGK